MLKRLCVRVCLVLALWTAAFSAEIARAQTWTITTLDSAGDVGRFADLQVDPSGDLHVLYFRNDGAAVKIISETGGVWGAPQSIDATGAAGGPLSLALDAGGEGRAAYRRNDQGALGYAGPEGVRSWSLQAVLQSGNVGQALSLLQRPDGEFGVAYRNQTSGRLETIRRSGGVWGAPEIVDPGPNRGQYFDLAYRDGDGYLFSEYGSDNGTLLLADPTLEARTWAIEQATALASNVGQSLQLLAESDGSFTAAFRNQTQGSLQYIRRAGGSWTAPTTVDAGPGRGQHFDITTRPGAGYVFSEYSPQDGALLYADSVLEARQWSLEAVTSGEENVGQGLSVVTESDGTIAASYRNTTQATLQHIRRVAGVWTEPVTVDPSANRGQSSDLARTPEGSYCFSEYDPGQGSLLLAHPDLQARQFSFLRVDGALKSGAQLSVHENFQGRLDCAYVTEEPGGRLRLKAAEIIPGYAYIVRSVADSVSLVANGTVTPDLYVTADHNWHIAYRKHGPNDLYAASTANFQLLPADAPDAPEDESLLPAAASHLRDTYPNPAPSGFRVRFSSAAETGGEIALYDVQGRCVRREEVRCARGENTIPFDGLAATGERLPPGVYFVRVRVGVEDLGQIKVVLLDGRR